MHSDSQLILHTAHDSLNGYLTPSAIPLTNSRYNPFKMHSDSEKSPTINKDISSSSIINEIEEKFCKQKEMGKDLWKPTSTRKMNKTKTINNDTLNPSFRLDSYFAASHSKDKSPSEK